MGSGTGARARRAGAGTATAASVVRRAGVVRAAQGALPAIGDQIRRARNRRQRRG